MTLAYTNHTGAEIKEIVLRTYAGAYESEETSPAATEELYDRCYPDGFSPGNLFLHGVWWNGSLTDAVFLDDAETVLSVPIDALPDGGSGTLRMRCVLSVPACAHRYGYADGVWNFGNALPILSVFENGAWRQDGYFSVGDPFVSECANYTVTLFAPKGYVCAATAPMTLDQSGEDAVYTGRVYAVRDFSFAISDAYVTEEGECGGVKIVSCALSRKGAARALGYAKRALQIYNDLFGPYPYQQLTLCQAAFPFGGMEYPSLICLGSGYYGESLSDTLELIIAHEAAHQWFYALVGSDQYNQPWQDEALCEYSMLQYVLRKYGYSAYENIRILRVDAPMQENIAQGVTPGSPIDFFANLTEYTSVVYGRGAAMMLALDEITGDLNGFLRAYCERFAFQLVSRKAFGQFLNEYSGMDLTPLLTDYLDTCM